MSNQYTKGLSETDIIRAKEVKKTIRHNLAFSKQELAKYKSVVESLKEEIKFERKCLKYTLRELVEIGKGERRV